MHGEREMEHKTRGGGRVPLLEHMTSPCGSASQPLPLWQLASRCGSPCGSASQDDQLT
jgi:hypothetical protein